MLPTLLLTLLPLALSARPLAYEAENHPPDDTALRPSDHNPHHDHSDTLVYTNNGTAPADETTASHPGAAWNRLPIRPRFSDALREVFTEKVPMTRRQGPRDPITDVMKRAQKRLDEKMKTTDQDQDQALYQKHYTNSGRPGHEAGGTASDKVAVAGNNVDVTPRPVTERPTSPTRNRRPNKVNSNDDEQSTSLQDQLQILNLSLIGKFQKIMDMEQQLIELEPDLIGSPVLNWNNQVVSLRRRRM